MKVAVVIPFFQRTRGLLATAVASVAAQQVAADTAIDIIVVDDGSPVAAASEAIVKLPSHCTLRIIARTNGGVAAARNTGLDAVTPDTDHIAFLDSDDSWAPAHLASAVACLSEEADFYFDNNMFDAEKDNFGQLAFMRRHHPVLDPQAPVVRQLGRDEAFDAILKECIPHTSQVVYRFTRHQLLRFDEDLKLAGEDRLFWLALADRSRATAYSTAIMGHRGRGVSIYRDTLSWDSPNGLSRVLDQMVMRKKILASFKLTSNQQGLLRRDIQNACNHFVFLSLRNSVRQPRTVAAALARMTLDFPLVWRMVPTALCRLPAHRAALAAAP